MNRRNLLIGLLLALFTALVLSACGGQPSASTEEPEVEETDAPDTGDTGDTGGETDGDTGEGEGLAAVDLVLWSQDETNIEEKVMEMFDAWAADNAPGSTLTIVHYSTEDLRTEFQTAAIAGTGPDFMWTVNDHAGPFTTAGLIQPVDDLTDMSVFVQGATGAVEIDGQHWGVPVSAGNHLMLMYNKSLVETPPTTVEELVAQAQANAPAEGEATEEATAEATAEGTAEVVLPDFAYFAYNLNEPFWLAPWWGAFGANPVLGEDGHTPTINTEGMIAALQQVHDFKYEYGIVPEECDYNCADGLFKEGKAAIIINGDWTLGAYREALGDDLGVALIPTPEGGDTPAPFISGKFWMLPTGLEGDKLDVVTAFINYMSTDPDAQAEINVAFSRLPALQAALDNADIQADEILSASAAQMAAGAGMPPQAEMRCVWDSLRPQLEAVMADQTTPEEAAAAAQEAADQCVADLQ